MKPQALQLHTRNHRARARLWSMAIGLASTLLSVPGAHALQLPQVFNHGPVTYVSGGVGVDEARAMKEAAREFSLEIMFVEKVESGSRAYSADNQVVVLDAGGNTMLNTSSDGPFMLIDLPPGRYTVIGEDQGRFQKQVAHITPGVHQRMVFQWPQDK